MRLIMITIKLVLIMILVFSLITCFDLTIYQKDSLNAQITQEAQSSASQENLYQTNGFLESNKQPNEELIKTIAPIPTSSNTISSLSNFTPTYMTTNSPSSSTDKPNTITQPTSTTPLDPEIVDDQTQTTESNINTPLSTSNPNNHNDRLLNYSKPLIGLGDSNIDNSKLNVLFYSIFIVYVSFIKLIYHNVDLIKGHLTEPAILMIFGIIWELVARQINADYDVSPKFNSRIFFYLFLPSTVLESAALLSNKWLLLNLLSILIHSILGTFLYASALGFTIHALSQENIFNWGQQSLASSMPYISKAPIYLPPSELNVNVSFQRASFVLAANNDADNRNNLMDYSLEVSNLTLADCLLFGTILSSIDSSTILTTFNQLQMNDKLYYLVLGENLLNNAVVLIIFDLLLDFFNETRLTVVKVYFAIIQFFITLIGSLFVGLTLALVALISIRLTKRFRGPNITTSHYHNQTQAMVETLLILKLAYLSYTLAELSGTSSIVSVATFGILADQYIKPNLNLRCQLTLRQVILATKTLGSSLVYPLLGMLLVQVSNSSSLFRVWLSTFDQSNVSTGGLIATQTGTSSNSNYNQPNSKLSSTSALLTSSDVYSIATSKLSQLAEKANFHWNFKFLSILTILTFVYRFLIVIVLSFVCNLFRSNQLRIKFKEQILLAYGSLKGPLAFAMVSKLIEHEEYKDKTMRNKHLFMYTILFITFVSTIIKGCLIQALVSKIQRSLIQHPSSSSPGSNNSNNQLQLNSSIVFHQINHKITECLSAGINSIVGHTKSPYDKFADFNELTIKPWLSRSGSNTNWLSVFYDNLILDETLNANCFYHSAGEYAHLERSNIRTSVIDSGLNSINPKELVTINKSSNSHGRHPRRRKRSNESNKLLLNTIHENHTLKLRSPTPVPRQVSHDNNNNILKEFVMFNLKLDEARKRRCSASTRVEPQQNTSGSNQSSIDFDTRSNRNNLRMISSSSSGDLEAALVDEEIDKHLKQRHLKQLELKLLDRELDSKETGDSKRSQYNDAGQPRNNRNRRRLTGNR